MAYIMKADMVRWASISRFLAIFGIFVSDVRNVRAQPRFITSAIIQFSIIFYILGFA